MKTLIKTLAAENGELYALSDSRRVLIAECEAEVRLYEHSVETPVFGRGRVINKRGAALLVTFRHKPVCPMDERFISCISRFEFQAAVLQSDASFERIRFDDCQLDGDLDLTGAGTCRFEIRCPPEVLDRLRLM
jgi:hypothetical protein